MLKQLCYNHNLREQGDLSQEQRWNKALTTSCCTSVIPILKHGPAVSRGDDVSKDKAESRDDNL